jgi:hypothetical protein
LPVAPKSTTFMVFSWMWGLINDGFDDAIVALNCAFSRWRTACASHRPRKNG